MSTQSPPISVQCCIVGGGPAGIMLGFLLSRAGISVAVLEKHKDFLRDFRGDTIHPSTLELMHELGLLEQFLQTPHQKLTHIHAVVGGKEYPIADFTHLPTHCKYIAFMPQWDFLNFLAAHAQKLPTFQLCMETEATELIQENGRTVGVRALTPTGPQEFRAHLTVGCDGRHSTLRDRAHLIVEDLGAPIDVLWMRLPRLPSDPGQVLGRIEQGHLLVMLDRGDYWQCAFVIRKGGYDQTRQNGLPAFQKEIVNLAPFLTDRIAELDSWEKIKLLTVAVDHLTRWHKPGLLCIGDAAHAMSPVGGVGINLAIQDAVAAANILTLPLQNNNVQESDLQAVQDRRAPAVQKTQRFQIFIHRRFLTKLLASQRPATMPWFLRLLLKFPGIQLIPARVIGIGFQPEHIEIQNGVQNSPGAKGF